MEDAHTLVYKETFREWRRRGGSHWGLVLRDMVFPDSQSQRSGHCAVEAEATVLRLASNQQGSSRALQSGGVPDRERGRGDDGGLELVVLEPNLVDDKLSELLTYFLKCAMRAKIEIVWMHMSIANSTDLDVATASS